VLTLKRTVFRVVNVMYSGENPIFQKNLTPLHLELKSWQHKKPEEAHRKLRSACCVLTVQNVTKL
jgi:hypothetical protein